MVVLLDNFNEMNTKTKFLVSGFVALSLVLSIVALNRTPEPQIVIKEIVDSELGALSGPNIQSPYLCVNGVCRYFARVAVANPLTMKEDQTGSGIGTSTICSIKSPIATSTLITGSLALTTGATTTSHIDFAQAANPYASTTQIGTGSSFVANDEVNLIASTSPATGETTIFPPEQYFNIKVSGIGNSYSPVGFCNATWEVQ